MTLFGWRQLIEWSLEHSCLTKEEYKTIHADWTTKWKEFLAWVIAEYGSQLGPDVYPPVGPPEVDAAPISKKI